MVDLVRVRADTESVEPSTQNWFDLPPCYSSVTKQERNKAWQLIHPSQRAQVTEADGQILATTEAGEAFRIVAGPASLSDGEIALKAAKVDRDDPSRLTAPGAVKWIGSLDGTSPEAVL